MSTLQTHQLDINIAGKNVCRQLNLCIEPGQTWGILGRNGIGKTTLLHTLAGLRQPTGGQINLDGNDIQQLPRKQFAKHLGLLLQQSEETFPATVLEMVLTGRHPHIGTWSWESEHDLEIAQHSLDLVDMNNMSSRPIDQLSGGERQRAAIAQLLTQSPDIYLLDEPNSHLDLHYQSRLLQHFSTLTKQHDASVVMSLHDINLAQYFCSHVALIFGDGEVRSGTAKELLTANTLSDLYQHTMLEANTKHGVQFIPEK